MFKSHSFSSVFIQEPFLTFGDRKQYIDPKMGLLAYGPCLLPRRRVISSTIRLGVIGSNETIELTRQWIDRCQTEIPGKTELPRLFQGFPGFTKVFGCELRVFPECIEVLHNEEIKRVTTQIDPYERIYSAGNLLLKKIHNLRMRDPRPHVVICSIPQSIINWCGRVSRGNYISRRDTGLKSDGYIQTTLIPSEDGDTDKIPEIRDLRRYLKAKAMELGIPTQLAKPTTLKVDSADPTIQDDATRAWNFCVALYYKAEGYPWKLAEMPIGTCYVGISFYRDPLNPRGARCSIAQIFTHTGEGLVLRGGRAKWDVISRSPHLSEETSFQLMTDTLTLYKDQMGRLPVRLVVHKSSRYWEDELVGFKKAADEVEKTDFITILRQGIRFMRSRGKYPPIRGTTIQLGKNNYLLFTKGWIPYHETYAGLRVPTPLGIVEHYGDASREQICKEILALTKMNWNSADFCISEPITLAYAREVGRILAYVPEEVIPRPEYRFYM